MSALGEPMTIRVATGSYLSAMQQETLVACGNCSSLPSTSAKTEPAQRRLARQQGSQTTPPPPAPGERVTVRENQNPEESTGVHSPENVLRGSTNDANRRIKHHLLLRRVFAQDQPCGDFGVQ